jgi:adenylosuccinate lyase
MRRNLDMSRGLIFSGTILLELAKKGVSRDEAYGWVQKAAMDAQAGQGDFKALLLKDKNITSRLSAQEIDRCFDVQHHLRHVDDLFKRTFGRA